MTVKLFTDNEVERDLKVVTGSNFVGFEIDGAYVVLSRAQILSELIPHLETIK